MREDVPYTQRITESGWVATVSGANDDPRQLVVHTWTGVDAQGIYAKQPPIGAERITIRGHDGYLQRSTQTGSYGPAQLDIWWTEQPGMVVSVSATDLYDMAQVIELIEQMVSVDATDARRGVSPNARRCRRADTSPTAGLRPM